jgi:hypothetical protein
MGLTRGAETPGFSVTAQGFSVPFFADFNLARTSDNYLHGDIVLVRATPDVLLVLITESGSDSIYKRIGISRRNLFTNEEKALTCVWELEGQKRVLSIR